MSELFRFFRPKAEWGDHAVVSGHSNPSRRHELNTDGRRYVLITPAHNEAEYIEKTIESVVSQTALPERWVIVSDRSTDATEDVVREHERQHPFIRLVRKTEGVGRGTANKVGAIDLGLRYLQELRYDFIGNLDADISFGPGYFDFLLDRLQEDSSLGIVGGRIHVLRCTGLEQQRTSAQSVAGAVQFFRRECFDEIGGYESLSGGFEDGLAEVVARLRGWGTRSYPEQVVVHYRNIGTIERSLYRFKFDSGANEFRIGFGYPYHIIRSLYYVLQRPAVVGSLLVMTGYLWACMTFQRRVLPPSTIKYLRKEQRDRLLVGLKERVGIRNRSMGS